MQVVIVGRIDPCDLEVKHLPGLTVGKRNLGDVAWVSPRVFAFGDFIDGQAFFFEQVRRDFGEPPRKPFRIECLKLFGGWCFLPWRVHPLPPVIPALKRLNWPPDTSEGGAFRPVNEAGLGGQFIRIPPIAKQPKARDRCCGYDCSPFEIALLRISMTVPDGTFSGSPVR